MQAATKVPFNYSVTVPQLLANTVSGILQIATDSDSIFEIFSRQASWDASNSNELFVTPLGQQFQKVYCTIYDTQIGRYLTNGRTPVTNIFGNSQFPNFLPKTHFLGRRSVLEIVIYNDSPVVLENGNLVFSGIKHMVQGE